MTDSPEDRNPQRLQTLGFFVGAAVLAGLLIAGGTWALFSRSEGVEARAGERDGSVIVLQTPAAQKPGAGAPMVAFAMEGRAHVIAVAEVGKAFAHNRSKLISLKIVDVVKGETALKTIKSADGYPPFGCIPPKDPQSFSELFQEGARVAVYLRNDPQAGWQTVHMIALDEQREKSWRNTLRPYLDMNNAAQTDDPPARYRELMLPDGKIQLDWPQYYVLQQNADVRAAGVLREILDLIVQMKDKPANSMATPENVIILLAKMKDSEAIPQVLAFIESQPAQYSTRYSAIRHLPALCAKADAKTVTKVLAKTEQFREEYTGELTEPAYRTLEQTLKALRERAGQQ